MKINSDDFIYLSQIEYYLNQRCMKLKINTNFKVVARRKGWVAQFFYCVNNRVKFLEFHFTKDKKLSKDWLKDMLESVEKEINKREVRKEFTAIKTVEKMLKKKTVKIDYLKTQKES